MRRPRTSGGRTSSSSSPRCSSSRCPTVSTRLLERSLRPRGQALSKRCCGGAGVGCRLSVREFGGCVAGYLVCTIKARIFGAFGTACFCFLTSTGLATGVFVLSLYEIHFFVRNDTVSRWCVMIPIGVFSNIHERPCNQGKALAQLEELPQLLG